MRETDFRKTFFGAENAGNMPEKPIFWHFLEISSFVFPDSCTKTGISNPQNMVESNFWEHFFPAENAGNMPEIAVSADFLFDFFHIFRCFFFHTKTLVISLFRLFVRSFVRSRSRSRARSYFHYQVGPISMWLVHYIFACILMQITHFWLLS